MKTAEDFLRDALGGLMLINAQLCAEVERLRAELAKADRSVVPASADHPA